MDLKSLINDAPPPEKKASHAASPQAQRPNGSVHAAPIPPSPAANGQPSSVGYTGYNSAQNTPLHPPPSLAHHQSQGLTPLQTPSHIPGGQYPFPQQSPGSAIHTPQYPSYAPPSATTPGPRPPSHGYTYPPQAQVSPITYQAPASAHHLQHHPTSSLSPTPPSHHSQTPHSMRQSPLSAIHPPPPAYQHSQHSQPSTPLGPPPLHYQRTSAHSSHTDLNSPYHSRTLSATSNSNHTPYPIQQQLQQQEQQQQLIGAQQGSPQHHPSIGNLLDSPSSYPALRRTSDYLAQVERERSLSVSPKTKVTPRPPSLGSRHSSQEVYSTRSSFASQPPQQHQQSMQPTSIMTEVGSHVSQSPSGQMLHSRSGVAQSPSHVAPAPQAQEVRGAGPSPSLSSRPQSSPREQEHSAQKMGMKHLLTPASNSIIASTDGAADVKTKQQASVFMKPKPSPKPRKKAAAPPPAPAQQDAPVTKAHQRSNSGVVDGETSAAIKVEQDMSKKRPADFGPALTEERPTKVSKLSSSKRHKYAERPIWARLAKTNERYQEKMMKKEQANGSKAPPPRQQANGIPSTSTPQKQAQSQSNGYPPPPPPAHDAEALPSWERNPPLDDDLIFARRILGPWEKTFCWRTPYPDLLKVVQDWLFMQLSQLKDLGHDVNEGTIEIEAKIGKILSKQGAEDRIGLPVTSMCVLSQDWFERAARFESQMDEVSSHLHMVVIENEKALTFRV